LPDYGHELAFGSFLTPRAHDHTATVALAKLSEDIGLDLVTFQDHPYQPAFLDTWTLLSWVAARTHRIRLSGNVLNLPLRPPAVLARAAASLDVLSSGRFEVALGAGAYWEAITAMGGPARTPAQAVAAVDEAIDILRALWDADARGGVKVDGDQYRVHGAKRGPAPAHPIPIWIGALGPRMLRLVATKADGWLPSLSYVPLQRLRDGNRTIDEAAVGAGRSPAAIRRLLNISGEFEAHGTGFLHGPPSQWVDDLLPLATDDGISTFILASDDAQALRTFVDRVAPLLREAVAQTRPAVTAASPIEAQQAAASS
jgi:alkanesulfonate monooxygenase SsuD/methylene tetrahydromethanopterin reductase-like flavin-dependent oxidoreductase (luciferase family)